MKIEALLFKLNKFEKELHSYTESLSIFDRAVGKTKYSMTGLLGNQSKTLLRTFAGIEPYIAFLLSQGFVPEVSKLSFAIRCLTFNIYDVQFPMERLKGSVIPLIIFLIGKISEFDLEQEIIIGKIAENEYTTAYILIKYLDCLHPKIKDASKQLFLDGYYHQAIEASCKAITQYIRDESKLVIDGVDLINTTFSPKKPILAFSDLSTETLENEQKGFMEMLRGFITGVRNPLAHNPAKPEDPQKAFEYLVMASLFCRRIDDTLSWVKEENS